MRGDLRPRAAREPDRQEPAVSRQSADRILGERTADRVVDDVDAATVGQLSQRRGEWTVAVVAVASADKVS